MGILQELLELQFAPTPVSEDLENTAKRSGVKEFIDAFELKHKSSASLYLKPAQQRKLQKCVADGFEIKIMTFKSEASCYKTEEKLEEKGWTKLGDGDNGGGEVEAIFTKNPDEDEDKDKDKDKEEVNENLNEEGRSMKTHHLVHETGKKLKVGDKVKDFRGDEHEIKGWTSGEDWSSNGGSGRVHTDKGNYYPSVVGAKIEKIDEGAVTEAAKKKVPAKKKSLIPAVKSLAELRMKAKQDKRYEQLAIISAQNLGGDSNNLDGAMRWLNTNAMETDEDGVVDEVNFCRDLIKED